MAQKVQSAPDEAELETIAQTELSRLKKQYRIMENDRAVCAEDAKLQLRSQLGLIDHLEYEKEELLLCIRTATSKPFTRIDKRMEEQLKCRLKVRDKYDEMIQTEKQEIAVLDKHIMKLMKDITVLKSKVLSDAQLKELAIHQEKKIAMLENQLEVGMKKFNLLIAQNEKVRANIEAFLKQRNQFVEHWNKYINQLSTGKQIVNDLIEQATIAFNQRDEELNRIQVIRERGIRDLTAHVTEMCELQRTLDNEMKLKEFVGVKGQHREMSDLNEKRAAERKAMLEEKQKKITCYRQILEMIKEFTGEDDIDKLTALFVKQEEENFALFSYVNELNDELEGLQARMTQLSLDIERARDLHDVRGREHSEELEMLKQELENQTVLADTAEENVILGDDTMEKLLKGIDNLFRAIRCENAPLLDLLGDNEQITMSNVMLYLGIIENRITDMFHKVYWIDKATKSQYLRLDEEKRPKMKIPPLERIAPTQPCALCVQKAELQIVSEGLERPLTRDEATKKLKERLTEDYSDLLHNISGCHLPAARKIMQKRYQ